LIICYSSCGKINIKPNPPAPFPPLSFSPTPLIPPCKEGGGGQRMLRFFLHGRGRIQSLLSLTPLYTPLSKGGKGGWREVWREVFQIP